MQTYGFRDLLANAEDRIECGHGFLKNHGDMVAAHLTQFVVAHGRDFASLEMDGSVGDPSRGIGHEAHDRKSKHGLAATGFTHDGQCFALHYGQADGIHRLGHAFRTGETGGEVMYFEDGLRHEGCSGFPAGIQQIHPVNNDTREFGVKKVAVVGGGLAGSECAWKLAEAGVSVTLFEMKPGKYSEAHEHEGLAELICSNSFRSSEPSTGIGLLHAEMRELGSLVMEAAEATSVPAGKALAVDRNLFSAFITERIEAHDGIELMREEVESLDDPRLSGFDAVCITAGPLASQSLADSLLESIGGKGLYFYDAIAPIVSRDSIDFSKAFWGSRWRPEDDDYLNCPMNEDEYKAFVQALLDGEKVQPHEFEKAIHFEGCLPVEEMAQRGEMTLAFGPLKPVGLTNPHSEDKPFAVIQLRAENRDKTAFNLVGFQTKLKYPEQKRIFRMIPGLENAEFLRLGSIHRNTYVNAPEVLTEELELKSRPGVFLAGQITGVEGYLESAACGLWLGMLLSARNEGRTLDHPPAETALGALMNHLRTEPHKRFQPSNVNFGLMPGLKKRIPKKLRKEAYAKRAREAFAAWIGQGE